MGRLIPAGTGLDEYKGIGIQIEPPEDMAAELEIDEELPLPPAHTEEAQAPGLMASGEAGIVDGDSGSLET